MIYTMEIECGEKTCAVEPGKFCRFFGTKSFGTISYCLLYNEPLRENEARWVARSDQCIEELSIPKAEVKS